MPLTLVANEPVVGLTKMSLCCFFLVFAGITSVANACVYFTCQESFHPWSPQLGPGQCKWQVARPISTVQLHFGTPPCPKSVHCRNQAKVRSACNCKEVQQCRWAAWGSWTGTLQDGSCRAQTRTRLAQATYSYRVVEGSCANIVSSCPRTDETEQRTRCRCRKANVCAVSPWTAWSGHIPNGGCATQTSVQPVTPHYVYIEQGNCHGIRSTCNQPRTNSRIKCLCATKDCTLQQWTSWSVISGWSRDACPKERRERVYTSVTRYIDAVNDCQNIGVKSCPPRVKDERAKDVKCPKLNAPPYGRLLDSACNGINSACHSTCSFACNNGFERRGKASVRCLGNGNWDGAPPVCHDVLDPIITCPNSTSYANEPGKNYVSIDLPKATAYDLVAVISVTPDHNSPLNLTVGTPVKVKYTARDAAGNTAYCTALFQAKDTEPPRVISCPDNIKKKTAASEITVVWPEPVFFDNVEGYGVDRSAQYGNGKKYRRGAYQVVYVAEDRAGNKARCEFNVTVDSPDNLCPTYKGPKNGSLVCNNKMIKNTQMYTCGISCQSGFGFAKFQNSKEVYNFYTCIANGKWHGSNVNPRLPSELKQLGNGRPWPDCSQNYPADAILKHFTIMAGPCHTNKTKDQLKKEFKAKLQGDTMIRFLFCTSSQCDVTDIEVTCTKSRKRSVGKLKIEFDLMTLPDSPPSQSSSAAATFSGVQDLRRIEELLRKQIEATIKRLQQLLTQLENQIKRILAHLLRINEYLLRIISKPFEVGCPHGSTLSNIGNPPRKRCTKCPIGEMYDSHSKVCVTCPKGTYQELEGRSYCNACPQGSTTLGNGASSINYCKDVCRPGTYSRAGHGLSTCMACRKGFYQPNSKQSTCLPCPRGKTTAGYGSTSLRDCK